MGSIYLYDLLYANLDPTIRLNNIAVKHLALSLSTQQSTHMSHVWLDQSLRVFISFQDIPIQESAVTLCET